MQVVNELKELQGDDKEMLLGVEISFLKSNTSVPFPSPTQFC